MRTIAVVTVGRSDFGIYAPVLRRMQADPDVTLRLIVSGAHLSAEFGMTVDAIRADGFTVDDQVTMLLSSDAPDGIAASIGLGVIGFSSSFSRVRPDMLVVLGDRFEMFAAAVAALPHGIPVAHIHGGEVTEGAMDEALRHSITKLSHLHFVSTAEYARRVAQLGEESWRITVSGAPALDHLATLKTMSADALAERCGMPMSPAPLLVTFHPATLEFGTAEQQAEELLAALDAVAMPVVFTQPNADTGGRRITTMIEAYVAAHSNARLVATLGTTAYFSLMKVAAAMVGNSSSGLIEAPSFQLPVVNIGNRQAGRARAANVIDTAGDRAAILSAVRRAVSPACRSSLSGLVNPYGDGHAADAIVTRLTSVPLDRPLVMKRFIDSKEISA